MIGSSPRRLVVSLTLAALLASTAGGATVAHSPDPALVGGPWTQDQRLPYHWKAGQVPPVWMQHEIRAAAQDSNESRASKAAIFALDAGPSHISYGEPSGCGPNGIACFRRDVANDWFTMSFRRQGYVFDWGTLKWCQAYETWPDGCYDVENIALDEFGHVEVLGHHVNYADASDYLDAVVQAVSRTKPRSGWNTHRYGRCDRATLQRKYDVPSSWTLVSTCLDLQTVLGLRASDDRVPYGTSVTLTATLRVATDDGYERLSANLLSGRDVVLQRRRAGTTSWISLGAMSSGSSPGTYTYTANLTSTADWRAVFSSPDNEGLRGDLSGVTTVYVGPCSGVCPTGGDGASE